MLGTASADETARSLLDLYERDFHAWCLRTAELLRQGKTADVDIGHLREEIEGLAGRDEREVVSRMKRILQHLLKLQYQSQKRTKSWKATLANQRGELSSLFEQSLSLIAVAERNVEKAYQRQADRFDRNWIALGRIPFRLPIYACADPRSGV